MPALNLHDFDLGNIECHYCCAPSIKQDYCLPIRRSCRCRMMQILWISFWDEDGEGHPCVVSFGFEHGWTKADGWCMVTTRYHRLLPELRSEDPTTSECKQNAVSTVGAPWTRSACAVTTRCTQWKRRESAGNRQLELHGAPSKRQSRRDIAIFRKNTNIRCFLTALWEI